MTAVKTVLLAIMVLVLSLAAQDFLEAPTEAIPFSTSGNFANKDKAYSFKVPEDGQMMRLEFRGTMPMNKWKAIDMEVYDTNWKYLFSYHDELWAETGTDSDGRWTEHRRVAYIEQRFPKKGEYFVYLSDSSKTNRSTANSQYTFRVVPIRGDGSLFKPFIYGSIAVLVICFIYAAHLHEKSKNNSNSMSYKPVKKFGQTEVKKKSGLNFFTILILILFLLVSVGALAWMNDDSEVNWLFVAQKHKRMTVDKSVRQDSLSGSGFVGGSGRGGK